MKTKQPFWMMVVAIPITYPMMILKLLVAIPIFFIGWSNRQIDKLNKSI